MLQVCRGLDYGAVQRLVLDIAGALQCPDHQVHVCLVADGVDMVRCAPQLRQLGCTVRLCHLDTPAVTHAARLRRLLAAESYDVVHAHLGPLSAPSLAAAQCCTVPLRIAHYHSTSGPKDARLRCAAYLGFMASRTHARATRVLPCSEAALRVALARPSTRAAFGTVLYSAIRHEELCKDSDRLGARGELGVDESTPIAGWTGEISGKNLGAFVRIPQTIRSIHSTALLLMVGDGPGHAALTITPSWLAAMHPERGGAHPLAPAKAVIDGACSPPVFRCPDCLPGSAYQADQGPCRPSVALRQALVVGGHSARTRAASSQPVGGSPAVRRNGGLSAQP